MNPKDDKNQMKQSEDAVRDDKIESMKPKQDDGTCGCDMSDAQDKEKERES